MGRLSSLRSKFLERSTFFLSACITDSATSILAIIANGLNIDLSVLETPLTHYIQPSYSSMIIKVLKGTSINTVNNPDLYMVYLCCLS